MDITLLDLSAYLGLIAVAAVTINMLLGVLMIFRYSPVRYWPHRRFNYFQLHNWTGYIALFFATLHPIVLLFNKSPKFRILDIVYPRPFPATATRKHYRRHRSLHRRPHGRHFLSSASNSAAALWKAFHFTVYLGAVALFWHSLFTDPDLQHHPVDWFDGGKVFVESCAAIILVTMLRPLPARPQKISLPQTTVPPNCVHLLLNFLPSGTDGQLFSINQNGRSAATSGEFLAEVITRNKKLSL